MKRALQFIPSAFVGGPEKQTLLTARSLRARGSCELSFFLLSQHGQTEESQPMVMELRKNGFETEMLPPAINRNFFAARAEMKRKIETTPSDIILSCGYKSDIILSTIRTDRPKISILHGWTGEDWKVRLYETIQRNLLSRFDGVVVISRSQEELLKKLGVRARRIFTIPNAFDFSEQLPLRNRDAVRREWKIPQNGFVIGTLARLSPEKGQRDLIAALGSLPQEIEGKVPYLVLIGGGPEEGALRELAAPYGERVKFIGFKADGPSWLSGLDLFTLPSHREALPIALLEAIAYKIPVVASAVGDMARLIQNGKTGWSTPPRDPTRLASAFQEALRDTNRQRYAEAAFLLLEQEHSPAHQAELWEALFKAF